MKGLDLVLLSEIDRQFQHRYLMLNQNQVEGCSSCIKSSIEWYGIDKAPKYHYASNYIVSLLALVIAYSQGPSILRIIGNPC
jgi:hypothetical protein